MPITMNILGKTYTFSDSEVNRKILVIINLTELAVSLVDTPERKAARDSLVGLKNDVNLQNEDLFTAGGLFAIKDHREACEFLISLGAGVNQIAANAAYGGNFVYAHQLIQRMGDKADLNLIAINAAYGGGIWYVEQLIQRMGSKANLHWISVGAAGGGYIEYARILRNRAYQQEAELLASTQVIVKPKARRPELLHMQLHELQQGQPIHVQSMLSAFNAFTGVNIIPQPAEQSAVLQGRKSTDLGLIGYC